MKLRADYTRYFLAYMTILFYSLCIPSSQYIPVGIALTALICFITKVSSVDATVFTVVLFAGAYFALESFMKYSLMNRVIFGITIICLYFLGFNWIRVIRGNVSDKFDLEKTLSGSANVAAEALDNLGWEEILGTIAGDNTIFIVAKNETDTIEITNRIRKLTDHR